MIKKYNWEVAFLWYPLFSTRNSDCMLSLYNRYSMNIDSMSRGGVLDNIDIEVTPSLVDSVYRRALRNRTYLKLHPDERAILYLARRLSRISSPTLKKVCLLYTSPSPRDRG